MLRESCSLNYLACLANLSTLTPSFVTPSLILCSGLRIVSDVKENPEFSTEVRFIGSVEQSARVLGLAHCCECSNASAHPKHLSHVVFA